MPEKTAMAARVLIYAGAVASSVAAIAAVSKKVPPEPTTPNYRIREITGIGHEKGVARRDGFHQLEAQRSIRATCLAGRQAKSAIG